MPTKLSPLRFYYSHCDILSLDTVQLCIRMFSGQTRSKCLLIHKGTKSTHSGFFKLLPLGTVLRFDHVIMAVMLNDLMNTWSVVVPAVTDLGAWYLAIPVKTKVKVKVT